MSKFLRRAPVVVGTLALAATLAAGTAWADESASQRTVNIEVEYTDINLATLAGAETLYGRIVRAARMACGPAESRSAAMMSAYRSCLKEAVDGAVKEVGSPNLSGLHQDRTPIPAASS
jgi:UrcA family protein